MKATFRILLPLSLLLFSELTVTAQTPETSARANQQTPTQVSQDADLIKSIKNGELASVLRILDNGVSPDTTDEKKTSAIIIAVRQNRLDIVEALLARHAKVDEEDDDNDSALLTAAGAGHADMVKLLIAHGANVNRSDHDGHSALICAAFGATLKSAPEWLARSFLEIEEADDLFRMMGNEHNLVAKLLIEAGAKVDAQGGDCGLSALMVAAIGGNVELVKLLLDHRANVKLANGEYTALNLAEASDLVEQLREMENADSKQAFLNWLNFTAPGRQEIARMLRKAGAN